MHPSAAVRPSPRPRRVRPVGAALGGIGLLLLGLACEPGIPTAPDTAGSVRLSPRGVSLEMGDSLRATAAALDADGLTVISGRRAQWTSSLPNVARVDSLGWVRGMAPGSSIITASIDGRSDTTTVTILPPSVQRLELSPDTATIILGQAKQLVAATYGKKDTLLTGRQVDWETGDPTVATVTTGGLVTAAGLGTTLITATSNGHLDTMRVTIVPVPVKRLPVAPNPALVQLGATLQLVADPQDSTGASLPGRVVGWSSANSGIAGVNATGLVTGAAVGATSVTATSEGVTTVVPVTVAVPAIGASRTSVTMTDRAPGPNPAPELVSITNTGAFTLSGLGRTIAYGPGATNWLTASFNQATAPATLTLQAVTGSLAPGTYTATVTVTSSVQGVAPVDIGVTFTVVPQPQIALSSTSPSFGAQTSGPNPAPVVIDVSNGGTGTLSNLSIATTYTGGPATGWLGASLGATTAPTTITLQPVTGSLGTGTYTAQVTVSSTLPNVTTRTIDVTFNVVAGPAIGLSSTAFTPSAVAFSTTPVTTNVNVTNLGTGTLDGLSTSIDFGGGPTGWLTASLASTTAPTTLQLSATAAGRSAGTYTATVTVASTVPGATSRTVNVTFTVTPQPVIAVNPTSGSFTVTRGAALPSPQLVDVTNAGGSTLSGLSVSDDGSWLNATLNATTAPATLTLQPNTTNLVAGTYNATVTLASSVPGVSSVNVPVSYTVQQPQISLSSTSVPLGSRTRGAAITSSVINVTNGGQGSLTGLSASSNVSWITPTLGSTQANTTLTLAYNTSGLTAGSYTGTVTVASTVPGVTSQAVTVTVTVEQPQIGLSSTTASGSFIVGSTTPSTVDLTVSNSGTGTLNGLSVSSIVYSAGASGWLGTSFPFGTTATTTLRLSINPSSVATAGTFTATVTLASSVPGVTARTITVTMTTRWSFATHIRPLLSAGCDGCHDVNFTYANLINAPTTTSTSCDGAGSRIVPNNTTASILYRKLADATPPCGSRMPPGGPFWSATDLAKIAAWINDGAPNN